MTNCLEGTHTAILDFLGRFEDGPKHCQCISDLADGVVLWDLMGRIDKLVPSNPSFNNQPTTLASVLANFKLIIQSLQNFYSTVLRKLWHRDGIDLIQIAHHKNEQQIVNLFMVVLAAAIESESKQVFIGKIITLPEDSQVVFVQVIKRALGEVKANDELHGYSPKVGQSAERRLLEKLEELEMDNDRLHNHVKQLEEEKAHLSSKLSAALDTINNEQRENERLNELLKQSCTVTDQKIKDAEKERSDAYIQNLKNKLLEVSRVHEKELAKMREELELERSGSIRLRKMHEQFEYYQEKYEQCKQILVKYEAIENEKIKLAKQCEQKEETMKKLKERVSEMTERIYELEEREVYERMELEKKSTRIEQLYKEIENVKSRSQQLTHMNPLPLKSAKSLSQICPEINNRETSHLKDHNQTLLSDLQKSTKKIRALEQELERYRRQLDKTHNLEVENKKLEEILLQYNQTRGEQNELLVGCLYQLRMKYKQMADDGRKDSRLSLPMRNHNRLLPKKMLS